MRAAGNHTARTDQARTDQARTDHGAGRRPHLPMFSVCLACAAGALVDYWLPLTWSTWMIGALTGVAVWYRFRRGAAVAAWLILVAAGCGFAAWHHMWYQLYPPDEAGLFVTEASQAACLQVEALGSPRRVWSRSWSGNVPAPPVRVRCRLPVRAVAMRYWRVERHGSLERLTPAWRRLSGVIWVTVPGEPQAVVCGDRLILWGYLSRPAAAANPGSFDYVRYLRRQRIICQMQVHHAAALQLVRRSSGWSAARWFDAVRRSGHQHLLRFVGDSRGALASAMLLGSRASLPRETTEAFLVTGTLHLLAISGLHVGMLVSGIWVLSRLNLVSRRATLLGAVLFVVGYALLTEARPPVVRAAVLVVLVCGARLLGRRAFAWNTLAAAGVFVLLLNPTHVFQIGTQLSFLAVATLCCWPPVSRRGAPQDPLQKLIYDSRPWGYQWTRRSLRAAGVMCQVTARIWVVSAPLVLTCFHLVTPIALALNPLLCLPVAVALFSGFGVLLSGGWAPPLAASFGALCNASLGLIERLLLLGARVPGGHCWLPGFPAWWTAGFYAAAACVCVIQGAARRRVAAWTLVAWCGLGLLGNPDWLRSRSDQLECTFISVGHGTCVLIAAPSGQNWLYDAGCLGDPDRAARTIVATLWSCGVRRLDGIILSHADADHYNAVEQLLPKIAVSGLYATPRMFHNASDPIRRLEAALVRRNIPIFTVARGHQWILPGGVVLEALHPPPHHFTGSDNADSLVLEVRYRGRRLLLPGDIEGLGMELLLRQPPRDYDVVMAPHHGSLKSDPLTFMKWSTPEWVVISGGRPRDPEQTMSPYQARGVTAYHTARRGAVRVQLSSDQIEVRTWRDDPW